MMAQTDRIQQTCSSNRESADQPSFFLQIYLPTIHKLVPDVWCIELNAFSVGSTTASVWPGHLVATQ